MNTPAITVVPSTAPIAPNRTGGAHDDAESAVASFSRVLSDQHAARVHDTREAVKSGSINTGLSHLSASSRDDKAAANGEELAKLASEQGLPLPLMALNMVAHTLDGTARPTDAALDNSGKAAQANPRAQQLLSNTQTALPTAANDVVRNEKSKTFTVDTASPTHSASSLGQDTSEPVDGAPHQRDVRALSPTGGTVINASIFDNNTKAQPYNKQAASQPIHSQPIQLTTVQTFGSMAVTVPLRPASTTAHEGTPAAPDAQSTVPLVATTTPVQSMGTGPLPGGNLAITTPLHQPQWGQDFSQQVLTLVQTTHNQHQTAQLRLDPPGLGPLHITININDNIAHAVFASAHASVRQAIESALPQLQQQLAQAGISLGQTSVNDQSQQQTFSGQGRESGGTTIRAVETGGGVSSNAAVAVTHAATRLPRNPNAMVDTFA